MNLRKKFFLLTLSNMLITCTCSTPFSVFASTNTSEINLKDAGQNHNLMEVRLNP